MDKLRILIADDIAPMRAHIRDSLYPKWEVVREVADGRELLEAVELLKPDVVLLDISMPVLDGLEAARRLRERRPVPPPYLIFVTSHADPGMVESALALGASGYVVKSRLVTELDEAIRIVVDGGVYVSKRLRTNEP